MIPSVTCFGEMLWDIFPTYKKIGGAPLNVALRLQSFGVDVHMISRVGKDQRGEELIIYMNDNGLDVETIQLDPLHRTGQVDVRLDRTGSAKYEIAYPVAWDNIEVNEKSIAAVKTSDAFIFGSLACRDSVSRNSLLSLLVHARFKVFDVNMRPPHYTIDLLHELMQHADLIKCNDDELKEICRTSGFKATTIEEQILFLAKKTGTTNICITKGADGAMLFTQGKFYVNTGYKIEVADTVGAGDSFLASLIYGFLSDADPQEAVDYATAVGALVASKAGANPKLSKAQISNFRKK